MLENPIGYWRTGGTEAETLPSGRHHLTREQVAASQKGRIMRAALHELGLRGANPMTISAVVQRARVAKKVFYDHFEGLAECVAEALLTLNVVAGTEMAKAAEAADRSQPFGRVRAVLVELIESAEDEPILTTALLAPGFGLEEPGAKAWLFYQEVRSKMLMAWYDDERERARKMGITDPDRIYGIQDLAKGNVMFCATGVTQGTFLSGIRFFPGGAHSHSVVMRSETGTIRYVQTEHRFEKKNIQ